VGLSGGGGICILQLDWGYHLVSGSFLLQCSYGTLTSLPTVMANPCNASTVVVTAYGALIGSCPANASATPVPSGSACALGCQSSLTYVSGGSQSCVRGVFSGSQPLCLQQCGMPLLPTGLLFGQCLNASTLLSGNGGSCVLSLVAGYALASGSLTLTCNNGTLSSLPTLHPPCPGSLLSLGAAATLGTCPNSNSTLNGGASCQLACADGYTYDSGGVQSCLYGSISGSQPVCDLVCFVFPAGALPAGLLNGSCFDGGTSNGIRTLPGNGGYCTLAVAAGYSLQSGSLQVTCTNGSLSSLPVVSGQFSARSAAAGNGAVACSGSDLAHVCNLRLLRCTCA